MRSFCFIGRGARGSETTFNGACVKGKDSRLFKKERGKGLVSTGEFYEEEFFKDLLAVERKKSERSRRPFLLMLVGLEHLGPEEKGEAARQIALSLLSTTRETDVKGWYKSSSMIGIIFTDPNPENDITCFQDMIFEKVCGDIKRMIGLDQCNRLEIELHVFPKDFVEANSRVNVVGVRGM
jgi:hypothetical protein